jgi:hypothetical protein
VFEGARLTTAMEFLFTRRVEHQRSLPHHALRRGTGLGFPIMSRDDKRGGS